MNNLDPFNFDRFLKAQDLCFQQVLAELEGGRKSTHWMWYVFPQMAGLGNSSIAEFFAIKSREEAEAYAQHSVLGQRLVLCIRKVLEHKNLDAKEIFGFPDYLKFHSSLTLFFTVSQEKELYQQAIDIFYQGNLDKKTIEKLEII